MPFFRFGLVCCFVTNEQIRISIENGPDEVDRSLIDAETYLQATDKQIRSLFVDNYDLLSDTLNMILDGMLL